jgi:hypothetical protein
LTNVEQSAKVIDAPPNDYELPRFFAL